MHQYHYCQKSKNLSTISDIAEINSLSVSAICMYTERLKTPRCSRWINSACFTERRSRKHFLWTYRPLLFTYNHNTWSMLHLSNRVIVKGWEGNSEKPSIMLKNHAPSLPSTPSQVFVLGTSELPFKTKVEWINLEYLYKHFMTTTIILNEFIIISIITIISEQLNIIEQLFWDIVKFRPTSQYDRTCFWAKI